MSRSCDTLPARAPRRTWGHRPTARVIGPRRPEILVVPFSDDRPGGDAVARALIDASEGRCRTIPRGSARRSRLGRSILSADAVLLGGGTILRPDRILSVAALIAAAKVRRVPVALVGVGAAPCTSTRTRSLLRWSLRHADLVVLRDEESASVLTAAGAAGPFWIGTDPAWALLSASPGVPGARSDGPPRMTALVDRSTMHHEGTAQAVADALDELARGGWRVRVRPWHRDDAEAAVAISSRSERIDLADPPADLESAAADMVADDLVLVTRFHGLVAAGAAGCRAVAVARDRSIVGLSLRLGQTTVMPGSSTDQLIGACQLAIAGPRPARTTVEDQIDLAHRTLALVRLLVDRGRLDRPEHLRALALSDGGARW